ncbi:MAG: hypothetical protein II972_00440 [Elusimicrobiaceae bacterium]|nr:hypothetical protein [Elusimicrobiaceae bacterium]
MRYWVYINDNVIEKPFEEGELSLIPGFNGDTLVCKETLAEGETQEWVPARLLIEAYKRPVPPPPPTKQVIDKFKEDTAVKESKKTILSSNIFGTSTDNNEISLNGKTAYNVAEDAKTNFTQTEAIFPQEKEAFEEDSFSEPPTEFVSVDDVKEADLDNHSSSEDQSEEEILKTAIRTLISNKNTKKENQTLQAIDIAHNRNIDLSDKEEEAPQTSSTQETEQKSAEIKNLANTELTLMGESKTGINHLFDIEIKEPQAQTKPEPEPESKPEQKLQEENKTEPTNEPLSEEEFMPEEEISLEDDDFIVADLNQNKDNVVTTQEEPSAREQEVLKEIIEDEKEALQEEEKELEEAFTTSPALIADLPQEHKIEQENLQETNNILEINEGVKPAEDIPTTLEELTGKFPLQQEKQTNTQENKEEGFIPAEVHPDIIVEEVKSEEVKEPSAKEQPKQEEPEAQLDKDNFLTTFSSDIETVFLDQPTAFISDYIPPEETKEGEEEDAAQKDAKEEILDIKSSQGQHQVSMQNVKRVKPAAIKTVPMVEGEQVDPFSKTQYRNIEMAEEARSQIEKKNNMMNLANAFGLLLIFFVMVIGFLGLIAQVGIMPKAFSPIHALFTKDDTKDNKKAGNNQLTPEELALRDLKEAETLRINKIISEVKNYKLIEGITLEEKIKLLHPNVFNSLKWEASQLPSDLTYYSVNVSSPTNPEGYAQVNYRFNYNTVTYNVEATTSEANNVMVTPYRPAQAQPKK